ACQNGGTPDSVKCICRDDFYGPLCEFILDRVVISTTVETVVKVEVKIQKEFTPELSNNASEEYQSFSQDFKDKMKSVYSSVPGYKDVIILSVRQGSIVVDHNVIVEIEYKENTTVTEDYDATFNLVTETLKELVTNNNCSDITNT
ncbi:hypothetical protein FKM82_023659, partial [Ascaphus truei]